MSYYSLRVVTWQFRRQEMLTKEERKVEHNCLFISHKGTTDL